MQRNKVGLITHYFKIQGCLTSSTLKGFKERFLRQIAEQVP